MNDLALRALELPAVCALLGRWISSDLGRARLADFADDPLLRSPAAASEAIAEAGEAMEWLREAEASERRNLTPPPRFQALADVRAASEQLFTEGSVLEALAIQSLLDLLARAEETRGRLWRERARRVRLGAHSDRLADFAALVRELGGKILPGGRLADYASSELARLRRQVEQQRSAVQQSLEVFVRKHFEKGILRDNYATVREGRSVVPVKASWKGQVDGVVHAASSTGQTVFIEPLQTITQNNRLVRLLEEESREVFRILSEMTEKLRERAAEISEAVHVLGELELVFAKARFGRELRCCLPVFSDDESPNVRLDWARHPLLEDVLKREGRKVEPLRLELGGERRALVISGPNAGGKTVALKTVGLLAVMAQCGLPVPAAEAQFPWFERILADIGDAQSIEQSLSTFSAHVERLKSMLADATGASLVILDELGSATDPHEGGALGAAVLDRLLQTGAFTLVSTHLPALKYFAANRNDVVSAAMGVDRETFAPSHQMSLGVPGESAGLAAAERLGLPKEIVERARAALADREQEASRFLETLRKQVGERDEAEQRIRQAEKQLKKRERELEQESEKLLKKKTGELERRFEKALRQAEHAARESLEQAIARIEAGASARRAESRAQQAASRALRETRQTFQTASSEALGGPAAKAAGGENLPISEGAQVRLGGLGATGRVVKSIGEGRWEVEVGQLRMKVRNEEISELLAPPSETPKTRQLPSGVSFQASEKSFSSLSEINVIGKTVDEAEDEVDKFLDDAVLGDVHRLRVVHGHGAGALRRALWSLFEGHVHVERYFAAEQAEGGSGATIVEVRT